MGFPRTPFLTVAEDLPLYRQSQGHDKRHALLLNIETIFQIYAVLADTQCRDPSGTFAILRIKPPMIAMGMEIARETGFK